MNVENRVKSFEYVDDATVNLEKKEVVITFKNSEIKGIDAIKSAIKEAGYKPL